jgi:hypothetical protein
MASRSKSSIFLHVVEEEKRGVMDISCTSGLRRVRRIDRQRARGGLNANDASIMEESDCLRKKIAAAPWKGTGMFPIGNIFYRQHIIFFHRFLISCLLPQIFSLKGMNCPPSSIFVDMHARHNRDHAIRFLSRQTPIILPSKLYSSCLPFEICRSFKTFKTSTNQYLVSNEYFCMVNPCCDLIKTTVVNENKNVSKMVDISLLQVKKFEEWQMIVYPKIKSY